MKTRLLLTIALVAAFVAGAVFGPPERAFAASDQGWNGYTAKTADYTVTAAEQGVCFTNRAATGTVIFTLPAPFANARYKFFAHANYTVTVKPDAVDTAVTFNDAAADSVSLQTTNEIIGGVIEAWSDGTSWFIFGGSGAAHTYTVAT